MKTIGLREFLRGGYLDLTEGTVVMKHGQPYFTVMPHHQAIREHKNGMTVADVVDSVARTAPHKRAER